jgi:dipeptidyl aminopeptidase/acylaminoacyl peptidase
MQTLLALALAAAAGAAPAAKPFSVDDLLALQRVSSPALSPDGRLVAFTVARSAPEGDRLLSAVWVVPAAGGAPRRMTGERERVSSPIFSPDGARVAFVSNRSGEDQAWVIDVAGGEAVRATSLPGGVSEVLWTPDGAALLVTSDVDPSCGADAACNLRTDEAAAGRPYQSERLLYRHWNAWRTRARSHVLRVPLDGSAPVDLTPGDRDVPPFQRGGASDLAVSPDGRTFYFTAVTDPAEAISTNADVYAVPATGGPARRLSDGPGWDGHPLPSPDGKRLAWLSQQRAGYESDRFHLLVAAADGAGARDLTPDLDLSIDEFFWADAGRTIRFGALEAGRHGLWELDTRSGKVRRLVTRPVNLTALAPARDGSAVAALVDSLSAPPEVAIVRGGEIKVLTRFDAEAMERVALGAVRPLEAKGKDGARIFGWLLTPPGHVAGQRHPGVVLLHGGPQGAWVDEWHWRWNAGLWAAQGYTVVLPNPRGSTGHGQAYTDAVRGNWGGTPLDDVLALADAAVASGELDGARTCAAGASYGGYLVNWINGQTDRFRCLVAHAGDFDLEMSYYDTEELWFPEWELGRPWERPEDFARWSPHRFVDRWKTPTLVTHGELDYRVTVTQGLGTFTALQRRGIPSKLLVFPDEGHWIAKPKNAKVFHDVVFAWLARWLGDAPPQARTP